MNPQVLAKLNQHPLNQAALRRLGPQTVPDLMHLLALAHFGSLDGSGDGPDPFSPDGKVLMDWGRPDAGRQRAVLRALEDSLEPEWVERADPKSVAEEIIRTLRENQASS
jgi:hypothetical protein